MDHNYNNIEVFTTDELVDELRDVLNRPKFKKQFPYPVSDFANLHLAACTSIKIRTKFTGFSDKDDNFLFDLALKTGAHFLITSDKLLLAYEPEFELKIMTFNKFRQIV